MRWQQGVINDLVLLSTVGIRPVLVHGGGPEINIWLNKLGIEAQFKNGLRVTDGVPPARDYFQHFGRACMLPCLLQCAAGWLRAMCARVSLCSWSAFVLL